MRAEKVQKWTSEDEVHGNAIILGAKQKRAELRANGDRVPSKHELHKIVCLNLYNVDYCHVSMSGVRSYISSEAAKIKAMKQANEFIEFVLSEERVQERVAELNRTGGLHPEDELHLFLHPDE